MTEESHRALLESVGAYLLGQLDPLEDDALRRHLAACEECRGELADLQSVANALVSARHHKTW